MKAEILDQGVDDRGVFTQHYGTKALDASNLLIPIMGFLPGDDERVRATVLAIADELTKDGLVLRYRVDATDDGLSGEEGTFTICSFWLVSALTIIGEVDRARALFQKLLSFAGPLHLYAEEIDATTGQHLGQLPPGVHAPRADRRRPAADRHRGRRGRLTGASRVFTTSALEDPRDVSDDVPAARGDRVRRRLLASRPSTTRSSRSRSRPSTPTRAARHRDRDRVRRATR